MLWIRRLSADTAPPERPHGGVQPVDGTDDQRRRDSAVCGLSWALAGVGLMLGGAEYPLTRVSAAFIQYQ
jgi:hypothetical protein